MHINTFILHIHTAVLFEGVLPCEYLYNMIWRQPKKKKVKSKTTYFFFFNQERQE